MVIIESMSVSSLLMMVRGANFPPIMSVNTPYKTGASTMLIPNESVFIPDLECKYAIQDRGCGQPTVRITYGGVVIPDLECDCEMNTH